MPYAPSMPPACPQHASSMPRPLRTITSSPTAGSRAAFPCLICPHLPDGMQFTPPTLFLDALVHNARPVLQGACQCGKRPSRRPAKGLGVYWTPLAALLGEPPVRPRHWAQDLLFATAVGWQMAIRCQTNASPIALLDGQFGWPERYFSSSDDHPPGQDPHTRSHSRWLQA